MASPPDPRDPNLRHHSTPYYQDSAELTELSQPQSSSQQQRPGYQRVDTNPFSDDADIGESSVQGLGIDAPTSPISPAEERAPPTRRIAYVPPPVQVGVRSPHETIAASSATATPATNRAFLSPKSPYDYHHEDTMYRGMDADMDDRKGYSAHKAHHSLGSVEDSPYDPFQEVSDEEHFRSSRRPAYQNSFNPRDECKTEKSFEQSSTNWLSISIYVLSAYSTIMSGIFFVIALVRPRYPWINNNGSLKPGGAIILVSVLAKTIELSFATAFVAFLGQALTRRAIEHDRGKGMSLAQMNMRNWIMQPGTLITHWETVRYAGLTFLGVLSLLAAIMATLYTSAATALVQPQLQYSDWEPRAVNSTVRAVFGDSAHVSAQCNTPQMNDVGDDGNTGGIAPFSNSVGLKQAHGNCLQVKYAAQSYANYIRYLDSWMLPGANRSDKMKERPPGIANWETSTEITGAWIDEENVETTSDLIDRIVHRVHLAMPHVGVMQAALDKVNGILQPSDLDGQGIYELRGSVPSPVMHVTCAHLSRGDLKPIVYSEWGPRDSARNETINDWNPDKAGTLNLTTDAPPGPTIMDDLFGWGGNGTVRWTTEPSGRAANAEDLLQARPIFPLLPEQFNTILNHTGPYGREQIYLLGRIPKKIEDDQYLLCSLKTTMTTKCSTTYETKGVNQGSLKVICEDSTNDMQYNIKHPEKDEIPLTSPKEWIYMASEWGNAINLNDGLHGEGSLNSRILTHLALTERKLNTSMPSPAEALAVMSSSTLLLGGQDSAVVLAAANPYNFTATPEPREALDASIKAQLYTSGAHDQASRGFMLVLFVVFILNLIVLICFIIMPGFVTDFTEPPNLFAIALQSSPSRTLKGACGGGPLTHQYNTNWFVNIDKDHIFITPGVEQGGRTRWRRKRYTPLEKGTPGSTYSATFEKHAKRKSIL